jgi:hypothetical protein
MCSVGDCQLLVRFDDAPAVPFAATQAPDGSTIGVIIQSESKFLTSLRSSSRVKIEATFFKEGSRVLEFATQGLNWETTKEEHAYTAAAKMTAARREAMRRCENCASDLGDCVRAYEGTGPTAGNLTIALKCLDAIGR